jgi:DNA invertase Pin-like site-specific DNA recombinase
MNRPVARIYQWVSIDATELARQEALHAETQAMGYSVAATYSESGPDAWNGCPQLRQLLADLNQGDAIIAEHLDRITRLPLDNVVALMGLICAKGARLAIPGLLDLSHAAAGPAVIVREAMQAMLLKTIVYQCRAYWEAHREPQRRRVEGGAEPADSRQNTVFVPINQSHGQESAHPAESSCAASKR